MFHRVFTVLIAVTMSFGVCCGIANAEVLAEFSEEDGTLFILGDGRSNVVALIVHEDAFILDGVTTDIAPTVVERIVFNMGGDVDEVTVRLHAPLIADIDIDTGSGDDKVFIETTQYTADITGGVNINTGLGRDDVYIDDVTIDGDVNISTGNGRDGVFFDLFDNDPIRCHVAGNLTINTGTNSDNVRFGLALYTLINTVGGNLDIELGQGNDGVHGLVEVKGSAYLSGGQGFDSSTGLFILKGFDPDSGSYFPSDDVTKIGFEN